MRKQASSPAAGGTAAKDHACSHLHRRCTRRAAWNRLPPRKQRHRRSGWRFNPLRRRLPVQRSDDGKQTARRSLRCPVMRFAVFPFPPCPRWGFCAVRSASPRFPADRKGSAGPSWECPARIRFAWDSPPAGAALMRSGRLVGVRSLPPAGSLRPGRLRARNAGDGCRLPVPAPSAASVLRETASCRGLTARARSRHAACNVNGRRPAGSSAAPPDCEGLPRPPVPSQSAGFSPCGSSAPALVRRHPSAPRGSPG